MSQSKKLEQISAEVIAFLCIVCLGGEKVLYGRIILGTSGLQVFSVCVDELRALRSPFIKIVQLC